MPISFALGLVISNINTFCLVAKLLVEQKIYDWQTLNETFEPSLWPWAWTWHSNLITRYFRLWWCTMELTLAEKGSAILRYSGNYQESPLTGNCCVNLQFFKLPNCLFWAKTHLQVSHWRHSQDSCYFLYPLMAWLLQLSPHGYT